MQEYIREPTEIYKKSFDTISSEVDLTDYNDQEKKIVTRIIHSCGDISIAEDIFISENAIKSGINALKLGEKIYVDSKMVAAGIIEKNLKMSRIYCHIGDDDVVDIAKNLNTTRSAAAVEHWKDGMSNSILVVGNAPTALFRVLEIINENNIQPGLIIGMPLGFVGAVEAKDELISYYQSTGLNIITIRGRRGGSAMASATVNAINLLIDDK
jgi:precorrin-8X/cobalt-precorrin-8 methylmutase